MAKAKGKITIEGKSIDLSADVYTQAENESDADYEQRITDEVWAYLVSPKAQEQWEKANTATSRVKNFVNAIAKFFKEKLGFKGNKNIQNATLEELILSGVNSVLKGEYLRAKEIAGSGNTSIKFSIKQAKDRVNKIVETAFTRNKGNDETIISTLSNDAKSILTRISALSFKPIKTIEITEEHIRHSINQHFGNNETDERIIPLVKSDFEEINEIIGSPDSISFIGIDPKTGLNLFEFKKETTEGNFAIIQWYGKSGGRLSLKTFYKNKNDIQQRSDANSQTSQRPKTTVAFLSDANIETIIEFMDDKAIQENTIFEKIKNEKEIVQAQKRLNELKNSKDKPLNYEDTRDSELRAYDKAVDNFIASASDNPKAYRYALQMAQFGIDDFANAIQSIKEMTGIEMPYHRDQQRFDNLDSTKQAEVLKAKETENAIAENNTKEKIEQVAQEKGVKLDYAYGVDEISDLLDKAELSGVTKVIFNLIKQVAKQLGVTVKFSSDYNGINGSRGQYTLSNHEILIDARFLDNGKDLAHIVVHEMIHGVTNYVTRLVANKGKGTLGVGGLTQRQITAVENLNKLLEKLKGYKEIEGMYGLSNIDELLAELANPEICREIKEY